MDFLLLKKLARVLLKNLFSRLKVYNFNIDYCPGSKKSKFYLTLISFSPFNIKACSLIPCIDWRVALILSNQSLNPCMNIPVLRSTCEIGSEN